MNRTWTVTFRDKGFIGRYQQESEISKTCRQQAPALGKKMMSDSSALKIALDLDQEYNLDDMMAELYLMKSSMVKSSMTASGRESQELSDLVDFSIHHGELSPNSQ